MLACEYLNRISMIISLTRSWYLVISLIGFQNLVPKQNFEIRYFLKHVLFTITFKLIINFYCFISFSVKGAGWWCIKKRRWLIFFS